MAPTDYQIRAYDFEECRLIESILPRHIDESELSIVTWQFLEFYETERSIAALSDYSAVDGLSEISLAVIRALIETSFAKGNFVGAVWVTGENAPVAMQLRTLLAELGLPPGVVVGTRVDAMSVLRRLGARIPESFELTG
jgi:hypothetical protein